jgi:hypothetical protein
LPCFSHDAVTRIEIHGHRLVKQENYSARRKIGLLVQTLLYMPSKLKFA